jgi:small-conductance mechanosensitive channel
LAGWFESLTQPQATLAAAAITTLGALAAIFLGWRLFSGKVKDIKSALDATDTLLRDHQLRVQQSLSDIEEKISGLSASTAQIRADASDKQALEEDGIAADKGPKAELAKLTFDDLSQNWHKVRDKLEEIAADSRIDGRTAAKYARIDRRNYADLVASLNKDGQLGDKGELFLSAAQIWSSHRTRKKAPSQDAIQKMVDLALLLSPAE